MAQWDKLIEFLGLGNLLHRNIHYLSGGEKQRAPIYDLLGRYVERLLQGENDSDNGQNIVLDFFAKNCFCEIKPTCRSCKGYMYANRKN